MYTYVTQYVTLNTHMEVFNIEIKRFKWNKLNPIPVHSPVDSIRSAFYLSSLHFMTQN